MKLTSETVTLQGMVLLCMLMFSREDFLRIPELAINPLSDRIVQAFFSQKGDSDNVS